MHDCTKYRGYCIRRAPHPTPINPTRTTWDICDGDIICKANIGSIEVAKYLVDVMIDNQVKSPIGTKMTTPQEGSE